MENNASLYFNCTACGKCCTSPPSFTSNEFLKFIDKFPFSIAISHNPLKNEKFFIEQKEPYATIKKIPNNFSMVYFSSVDFQPLFTNSVGCNQLNNKLCNLHEDKPLKCKVVPFVNTFNEDIQISLIENVFKKNPLLKEGCLTKENKENYIKIYDSNKIIDNSFKSNFDLLEDYLQNQKGLINEFLVYINKTGLSEAPGKQHIINPAFFMAFLCFEKNQISVVDFISYLEKQNEQYKSLIDRNLKIKDKSDKTSTEFARKFLEHNLTFIKGMQNELLNN